MSLRRKLFLLLGGLICLLLVGQWLLFRSLTRAVAADVRTVAFRVGEEILSGFSYRTESRSPSAPSEGTTAGAGEETTTHVVVVATNAEGGADVETGAGAHGEAADPAWTAVTEPPAPAAGEGAPPRLVLRREVHLRSPLASATGPEAEVAAAIGADPPPGAELRKMVLETDAESDVLFVRGPAMKRAIPIPHAEVASTLDRFGSQLLLGNLVLLGVGLLAAAVVAHRLTRPLANLSEAAERLGRGELGAAVGGPGEERNDEIGRTIASFNRMSHRLAELDRENRRLASAEQLSELGEVARGLAHSLRNPLNALGLAIEQGGAPPEVVEGSRRQIRRMDGALRSFLALASAGSAQAEPVDLAQLAREVALEALQDGGGQVRIDVQTASTQSVTAPDAARPDLASGAGRSAVVAGVPAELKAVLQALVVNAVEASPPGGQVAIRVEPAANGAVRLTVDDEGSGLPERIRARLFEPHVTTKPHGSGMGLFLAHRLVSGRYAGELRLAPRAAPAAGTRATLELGDRVGERGASLGAAAPSGSGG
jgi:signal transduction histidine kinase